MKKSLQRAVSFFLLVMMVVSLIPTSALAAEYFPAYTGKKTVSIVDALYAVKAEYSYAYRKQIAAANGIEGYRGTADQNIYMLELLEAGKLVKPAATAAAPSTPATSTTKEGCFPAYKGKVTGFVQSLIAVGANYSFEYRRQIAVANGVVTDGKDYKGTYAQNAAMIKLLVAGDLKKPA